MLGFGFLEAVFNAKCRMPFLLFPLWLCAAPLRVISLSPHTTELAYEAGLGESLIAVSEHSDYPPQAAKLEQVANFRGINLERVVALKPDLVLAWQGGNPESQLIKLRKLGIEVFSSNPHSLEEAADNIETLGQWSPFQKSQTECGIPQRKLAAIQAKHADKPSIRYFYQLESTPLMTNNGKHWPQPLFSLCGGENIFANSLAPYPQVNIEQVINAKPQAIFFTAIRKAHQARWKKWQEFIPAVQLNAFYTIDAIGLIAQPLGH